jgi:predicted dehydrogenase/acetyltransferase-like isoleucine patch superfamily enzyme
MKIKNSKIQGIAVIGAGAWGKNLARNYAELGVLKTVCDVNSSVIAELSKQFKNVGFTENYNDVLDDKDINGVVIATPAAMHFSLAREALLSGKDVFVEKPLALDLKDAEELKKIADKNSRILMVGHLLQYHPCFIKLKEMIRSGALGRIDYIYSTRLNFGKIRREEDIMWSFAPHDISMILSIANEAPEAVIATGGYYLHKKIADVTTTHLEFASGLRAHVFVSWLHPFKEQKLVVVGEKGMAVFNDTLPWPDKLQLYPHNVRWENGIPVPDRKEAQKIEVENTEPLKRECEHFIECVQARSNPLTDGHEGINVLKILKAGQLSLDNSSLKILIDDIQWKEKAYYSHSSSYIDDGVEIGEGTKIWHFSHVLKGSRIGRKCNIGQNVVIGPDVTIGSGCRIQNNVSVYKGVTLEDDVFCGPSMVFTNVYNPRAHIAKMDEIRPTLVKKGATIGANATIVCGHTIGEYAFIGAGAVLTRGAPAHALMIGNPARQIGWMCQCGERLDEKFSCSHCGNVYEITNSGLNLKK